MTATRFIVIRHGETEWNLQGREMGQLDSPLTLLGNTQARRVAERLQAFPFDDIYSSDLGRASRTAEIVAQRCGRAVKYDARLRERNMGVFQGLTADERELRFPKEREDYRRMGARYVIPAGESADQCIERSMGFFGELAEQRAGQTLVIITHGGVLMGLFERVLGLPFRSANRFRRANASWNEFTREEDRWVLETWGDISHLRNPEEKTAPN
jgi:2,3-bisphosphoglycerate-dependent phosphoglycerate mutase